jgi:signal transduction histidine kinase
MTHEGPKPRDKMTSKFWGIFLDAKIEESYFTRKFRRKFLLFLINIISLLYSIFNLVICLKIDGSSKEIGPLICSTILILNFMVVYCGICYKNNSKATVILAYLQKFLISTNHLTFFINFRAMQAEENNNEHLFSFNNNNFIYIFTSSDILIKQMWILFPFNNFFYHFISNFCFSTMFFIVLPIYSLNFELNQLLSLIIYFLFICLSSYLSRKIMINEKKLFIKNSQYNNKDENENFLENNLNTGYLKFSEYEIKEKNNFFENEGEYFKTFLKSHDKNLDQKENFLNIKDSFKNLNSLNLISESLGDVIVEKKIEITHEEIIEILKNILLNLEPEENFHLLFEKILKNLNSQLSSKNKNFVINNQDQDYKKINYEYEDFKIDPSKSNDLENSTNNLLNINLEIKPETLTQEIKNSSKNFLEQILDYFYTNYLSYTNFTSIGKIKINQRGDKILSLEVLVRVRVRENNFDTNFNQIPHKYIEFIFNDITKNDLSFILKNLLIKTGQYLHDFKNPLICIQNEITELKEETEVIMAKLCQQNDFIDNLKRSPLSSSQRINNANKNLDISIDDCLQILDKFEYAKQMSEYCQSMIGSYEDFSKSIFSPQSISVSFHSFDLIMLLNFINNFMQIQINRLNKNLNFDIILQNFEDELYNKQENKENKENITLRYNNEDYPHKNVVSGIPDNLEYFNSKKIQEIIHTDESKLKRVLLNILSNSIKFTSSGSITLTVKKEKLKFKTNYDFSIKDTGIGMSDLDLKKLFTPFFSKNTSEMNKCGVGLGLINVKEITEKLGGGLKVTSRVNEGTTMSFLIEDKVICTKKFESTKENSIFIIQEGKSLNNSNETSNSYEFQEQPTIEIKDQIFMINNTLKMKELNDVYSLDTDCDVASSFYTNLDSFRKEKTITKYSRPEIVLNSSLSNINNENYNKNEKKVVNSNFLIPFTNISQTLNRSPSLVFYSPRDSSSKNSSHLIKIRNMKTYRSSKLSIRNSHSKRFLEKLNVLTQNNFSNLKYVTEINYEILVPVKNSSDSPFTRAGSCKNCTIKTKINEDENFFKRIIDYRKKSTVGLNTSSFKRGSIFVENQVHSQESRKSSEIKRNISVLIIDDEKSIRSFYKTNLKKISEKENVNFIIEEADDGSEGLSKILVKILKDQEIYDLIITDDSMTLIDGSHLYNIINFIFENEQFRKEKSTNFIDKFIICSSDLERVKNKILFYGYKNFDINKNLILCEKPLKLDLLKSLFEISS